MDGVGGGAAWPGVAGRGRACQLHVSALHSTPRRSGSTRVFMVCTLDVKLAACSWLLLHLAAGSGFFVAVQLGALSLLLALLCFRVFASPMLFLCLVTLTYSLVLLKAI